MFHLFKTLFAEQIYEEMKKIAIYVIIGALLLIVGYILGRSRKGENDTILVQRDTTFVRDTIVIEKPSEVRKEYVAEKILVPVRDTVWLHDTLFVQLPMQKKFYREEDYYAEVSGYNPSLDYLEIYNKTVYVTKTEREKEKRNYLAVGMDASWCIKPSIPIYLEYTRVLHKNVALRAGVFHDLAINETGFRVGVNANIGW